MTVNDLLNKMSSYELTEWMAFERVNGPLGQQYSDDMSANIHEQLQAIQFILGRMSAGEESPVPAPHRVLRPHEVLTRKNEEVEDPDLLDVDSFASIMSSEGKVAESKEPEKQLLPGT